MKTVFQNSIWFVIFSLFSVALVIAQGSCSDLVNEALLAVDDNCDATGRNEACYGFNQVEASFLSEVSEDFFSEPASKASVADLTTIRTAPLNTEDGIWGVAVMNLQANLPNTLPGQNVTFILFGDVEVENGVDPENAYQPSDGIAVTISSVEGANIRSGASLSANVIGGADEGDTFVTDGLSEDGEWLRIAFRNRPAWVSRIVVADDSAIDDLPILSDDLQTPMQAIYLRTGIGAPVCEDAIDDVLLVQGPENVQIELTVNGADISLGSSGALRIVEIDGELFLEVIVFDGVFEVDGQTIQAGQSSLMCLGNEDSYGLDGEANDLVVTCEASEPQAVDTDEFGAVWCSLESIPASILHYSIEILCPGETPPTPEPVVSNVGPDSELASVDCSTFSIPPQPIIAGNFTLSWTAAEGADTYEVAVFDSNGFLVSSIFTTSTSIGLNGGESFPPNGYVDIRAYRGGEYACFVSLGFTRGADPNEPPGGYSNASIDVNCFYNSGTTNYELSATWSDQTPPITISWFASGGFPMSGGTTSNDPSGSYFATSNDFYGYGASIDVMIAGQTYSASC